MSYEEEDTYRGDVGVKELVERLRRRLLSWYKKNRNSEKVITLVYLYLLCRDIIKGTFESWCVAAHHPGILICTM